MAAQYKDNLARLAAIEVCHSKLHLVMCERTSQGKYTVSCQTTPWRIDANALHSETGQAELAAALKPWISKHRLQGSPVQVALSGDYCVTRTVSGEQDQVRQELARLEQRSSLYLSLGPGAKAIGASTRQLDARHQQALLAVVNQRTLDALVEVGLQLGVRMSVIEPSLVALCRLAGHLQGEDDPPAVIVNVSEKGVDVGITHRGQLLLDYRPAGRDAQDQVPTLVSRHWARLQRYCDRYLKLVRGRLDRVYLCGDPETVKAQVEAFAARGEITAIPLDPTQIDPQLEFSEPPTTTILAALGTALRARDASAAETGPNLLAKMLLTTREPLRPALIKLLWPLAAMMLLAVGAWFVVGQRQSQVSVLRATLDDLSDQTAEYKRLTGQIGQQQQKIKQLQRITDALPPTPWKDVTEKMAQCLPDDVWLDGVRVSDSGKISITGAAYTEDGVFEFVRWLKKFPNVERVSLSGTRVVRMPTGPATQFDVQANLAGKVEEKGGKNASG